MRNLKTMLFVMVAVLTCSCLDMPARQSGMWSTDLQGKDVTPDGSTDTGSDGSTDGNTDGGLGPRLTQIECPPNAYKGDGSGSWDTECYTDLWYGFTCSFDRPASPNECLPIRCEGNPTTTVVCTQVICSDPESSNKEFMVPNPNGSDSVVIFDGVGYCGGDLYNSFQDVQDHNGWYSATGTKMPGATPARHSDIPN